MKKDINLFKDKDSLFFERIRQKKDLERARECDGYLIDSDNEKEIRRIIDSVGKKKLIAVYGGKLNRRILESMKVDYLVYLERGGERDTLKQRDSGFNHVLAKIASKKGIKIVIPLSDLRKERQKELMLARIMQNIAICRKNRCDVKIVSLADNLKEKIGTKTRQAIGLVLGMSTEQAKKSVEI